MRTFQLREDLYGVPIGVYLARFLGIKDRDHPDYGDGVEWSFEITDGPFTGKQVSRTTATVPTKKNSCGRFLAGIRGAALTDEIMGIEHFIGRTYQIVVEANSTDTGTRVASVMAAPQPPLRKPTPPLPPRPAAESQTPF